MKQEDAAEIRRRVGAYVLEEHLPGERPENLTGSTELITSGIINSLATLKLVAFLEETFGVAVQAHEVNPENLDSLDRITAFVLSKRS